MNKGHRILRMTPFSPNRRMVSKRGISGETRQGELINRSDLKSGFCGI